MEVEWRSGWGEERSWGIEGVRKRHRVVHQLAPMQECSTLPSQRTLNPTEFLLSRVVRRSVLPEPHLLSLTPHTPDSNGLSVSALGVLSFFHVYHSRAFRRVVDIPGPPVPHPIKTTYPAIQRRQSGLKLGGRGS